MFLLTVLALLSTISHANVQPCEATFVDNEGGRHTNVKPLRVGDVWVFQIRHAGWFKLVATDRSGQKLEERHAKNLVQTASQWAAARRGGAGYNLRDLSFCSDVGGNDKDPKVAYQKCFKVGKKEDLVYDQLSSACLANMGAYFTEPNDQAKHLPYTHSVSDENIMIKEVDSCSDSCKVASKSQHLCKGACIGIIMSKYFKYWYGHENCKNTEPKCQIHCNDLCRKLFKSFQCSEGCSGNLISNLMPKESRSSDVWRGPLNTKECPGPYALTLTQCIYYAQNPDHQLTWKGTSEKFDRPDWPKGCLIWVSHNHGDLVYFNNHSRGGSRSDAKPICQQAPHTAGFETIRKEKDDCKEKCATFSNAFTSCQGSCMKFIMSKYVHYFYGQDLTNGGNAQQSGAQPRKWSPTDVDPNAYKWKAKVPEGIGPIG